MGEEVSGRYCRKVVATGKPLMAGGLSLILPPGSKWTRQFSAETLRLRQENAVPSVEEYQAQRHVCELSGAPTLTLGRLYIFFIMSYGACFLIFLEMILDPQTAPRHSSDNEVDKKSVEKHGSDVPRSTTSTEDCP